MTTASEAQLFSCILDVPDASSSMISGEKVGALNRTTDPRSQNLVHQRRLEETPYDAREQKPP